jgi:hypothetical protein
MCVCKTHHAVFANTHLLWALFKRCKMSSCESLDSGLRSLQATYLYLYICFGTHTHTHTHTHTCIYTYICLYIYICIYIYNVMQISLLQLLQLRRSQRRVSAYLRTDETHKHLVNDIANREIVLYLNFKYSLKYTVVQYKTIDVIMWCNRQAWYCKAGPF